MGISINAYVAFGISVDPEDEDTDWFSDLADDDGDFDFEEFICKRAGLEPLDYSGYPDSPSYGINWTEARVEYDRLVAEWRERVGASAYFARKSEIIAACPLDQGYAGHLDNPVYVFYLRGTEQQAYWSPEPLDLGPLLSPDPVKIEAAKNWATGAGIPWDNPQWLLYPSYSH